MAEERTTHDRVQGLVAVLGIALGVLPLVRLALGGEVGRLLSWAPATDDAPGSWLVPAGVCVVCVVVVALLERSKPRA